MDFRNRHLVVSHADNMIVHTDFVNESCSGCMHDLSQRRDMYRNGCSEVNKQTLEICFHCCTTDR
jgi:hypothetical protein